MKNATYFILCLFFISCSNINQNDAIPLNTKGEQTRVIENTPEDTLISDDTTLLATSTTLITLLKNKQFHAVSQFVHPSQGVRFSPYAFIDTVKNIKFNMSDLDTLSASPHLFIWGEFDGSGDTIQLDFNSYYKRFIYDLDFKNAEKISENSTLEIGNAINNLTKAYKNCEYVEYYFSGVDEKYQGMDWRALRLVFKKENKKYWLVGIIHSQWTI